MNHTIKKISEDKNAIYQRSGYGRQMGFGRRPALLIIDMQRGFTDPNVSPLACNFDSQMESINKLVTVARIGGVPIIFIVIAYAPNTPGDGGLWLHKIPTLHALTIGSELVEIDPRLNRAPDDILIMKKYPSAFFGTNLAATLNARGIDTVIITGGTTGGCILTTAIDALSHGFRPIIPATAVGDRVTDLHDAALFNINNRYGDVVSVDDVVAYLESAERQQDQG